MNDPLTPASLLSVVTPAPARAAAAPDGFSDQLASVSNADRERGAPRAPKPRRSEEADTKPAPRPAPPTEEAAASPAEDAAAEPFVAAEGETAGGEPTSGPEAADAADAPPEDGELEAVAVNDLGVVNVVAPVVPASTTPPASETAVAIVVAAQPVTAPVAPQAPATPPPAPQALEGEGLTTAKTLPALSTESATASAAPNDFSIEPGEAAPNLGATPFAEAATDPLPSDVVADATAPTTAAPSVVATSTATSEEATTPPETRHSGEPSAEEPHAEESAAPVATEVAAGDEAASRAESADPTPAPPSAAPDASIALPSIPVAEGASQREPDLLSPAQQAPAPGGATAIEQDVDAGRFLTRASRAVGAALDRGGGPIEVRLSPPELGALRVQIEVRDGALTAAIEAETPAARNLLLDNLPALRDRLAEQSIRIEKFDVDVRDDTRGRGEDGGGGSWQSQSHADRRQDEAPQRSPAAASAQRRTPSAAEATRRAPTITFTDGRVDLVA